MLYILCIIVFVNTYDVLYTVLTEMTGHYHKCLLRCKELHKMGVTDNANMSASVMTNTADRIIYTYAIDMVSGWFYRFINSQASERLNSLFKKNLQKI